MKNYKSKAIFVSALFSTFASQTAAQTTFSHDNTIAITAVGGGEDLLTEGAPGPPGPTRPARGSLKTGVGPSHARPQQESGG